MHFSPAISLALAAVIFEAAVGYPDFVYRRTGHPVTWIGGLIGWLDKALNRESDGFSLRRAKGVVALVLLLAITGCVALPEYVLRREDWPGFVALAVCASSLIAQRSLHQHVSAVAIALDAEGLAGGRRAVSMIVGRNPAYLDESGVARAAIESLAENFSDGIVAPVFWIALGGLTGGALYKAANTADSMIGHRTPRHAAFGWAAARFDDLVNLPASRLSALWLAVAAMPDGTAGAAMRAAWRDAGNHRSPNAGWPEAAMAGALGLQLAGPRVYGEAEIPDAFMGDGRRDATSRDIFDALRLFRRACALQAAVLLGLVLAL